MTLPPSPGEIVMIPASPSGIIGPGLRLDLNAGLTQPTTPSTVWDVEVTTGDTGQHIWSKRYTTQANPLRWQPYVNDEPTALPLEGVFLPAGHDVQVSATVQIAGGGAADAAGAANFTWDPTAGLPAVIKAPSQGAGLTPEQAVQLDQTHQGTWVDHAVDTLTLQFHGHGGAGLPIGGSLTSPVFGVIVRLTSVPEELVPQTPDGDYWVPTLAVVRIFRGSDLWLRVPIHTSSKLINLWVEGLALGLADMVLNAGWLLNLTIQVTFLPGVEGDVFTMRLP